MKSWSPWFAEQVEQKPHVWRTDVPKCEPREFWREENGLLYGPWEITYLGEPFLAPPGWSERFREAERNCVEPIKAVCKAMREG